MADTRASSRATPGSETPPAALRRSTSRGHRGPIERPETTHASDILFTFVLAGRVTLDGEGQAHTRSKQGDAYVVPPGLKTALSEASPDLELLEVSLPALGPAVAPQPPAR